MGLTSILLLGGQLILAADISQAYNTAVFLAESGEPQGAFMTVVQPRARARLAFPRSDYHIDYAGGFTLYDFSAKNSELSHRGELRGQWQLGQNSTAQAYEQLTYGTDNTLRTLDLSRVASPEINGAQIHYILNQGRVGYHYDAGETSQLELGLSYTLRRTVDGVTTDDPIISFDSLTPGAEVTFLKSLNDDNQFGGRVEYAHYFSPTVVGGGFFDSPGRYALQGNFVFNHRFEPWWTATLNAGGVYARSLDPDFDDAYIGPVAGASSNFRGPRLSARVRYEHGYGAYGQSSGSAVYDQGGADLGFYPNPLEEDINLYGEVDARRAIEVLGDLGLENISLGATVGLRYKFDDYVSAYGQYEWRFQSVTGTPGGEDDLVIRRHIGTVGVIVQWATPHELDVGGTDVLAETGQ